MKYTVEENLEDFEAWSGGRDTLNDLIKYDAVDEAEEYIDMLFTGSGELPTQTEVNDILWFDRDEIYRYCGIYKAVYGEDEAEEEEEEE